MIGIAGAVGEAVWRGIDFATLLDEDPDAISPADWSDFGQRDEALAHEAAAAVEPLLQGALRSMWLQVAHRLMRNGAVGELPR